MAVETLVPNETASDSEPEPFLVHGDEADTVLDVLTSAMARRVLEALYEGPGPVSELAERAETSLQNAQYHLGRLDEAGLVETTDTWYSSKGREMNVYAPTGVPVVVFGGDAETEGAILDTFESHLSKADSASQGEEPPLVN